MRSATPTARRASDSPLRTANTSHSTGAIPTSSSDVAFVLPTTSVRSANSAGSRQPPRRRARAVNAIIHGSPAHGRRIAEIRPVYASWYGVSM